MATAVKTAITLQASASNASGGTTTGTAVTLTTALGLLVTAKITNGATGPTLPCSFYLEVSNNNTAWKVHSRQDAGTTALAVYEFSVDLPPATMYARSKFTGNTGQTVTVESFGHELTSIA